ncbi:MAG: DUF1573 domain-containing protein [Bacteroidetes bacterium]|nr:DUF1573 domain-containing protein [Bacteroidota bacterium]
MKKRLTWIFAAVLVVFTISCGNQGENESISSDVINNPITANGESNLDELPVLEFLDTTHDFGNVIQGEKVTYAFRFTNAGKSDLIIAKVSASCGCTATEYPRHAIKPGEKGVISITFDSEGRLGFQNKTADVLANTQPNLTTLRVKAKVITPESMR